MRTSLQWIERSRTCLVSAKLLLDEELLRDSVSRSYYAAYSAATGHLIQRGVTFAHGWNNPSHEQLPDLILNNTGLPRNTRLRLNRSLRLLRQAREDSDYRPGRSVDRALALDCLHSAIEAVQILEV